MLQFIFVFFIGDFQKRMNRRFILFSGLVLVVGWVNELQNLMASNKLMVLQMWKHSSIGIGNCNLLPCAILCHSIASTFATHIALDLHLFDWNLLSLLCFCSFLCMIDGPQQISF